jgi:hypothetical protein
MHPMFVRLKECKQGSGSVDDEDVPEYLKSTSAAPLTQDEMEQGYTDNNFHIRYKWVLDEVIWSLSQSVEDTSPEYTSGDTTPFIQHHQRLDNGFRLMGKYWQTWWD